MACAAAHCVANVEDDEGFFPECGKKADIVCNGLGWCHEHHDGLIREFGPCSNADNVGVFQS